MKQFPIYVVDAFTSEPFAGNPAAVCLLSENLDSSVCQKIAFEMNLSETAFIQLIDEKDTFEKSDKFHLRWFTPTNEVPLCGHATLASATVLFKICSNVKQKISFTTLGGELLCRRSENDFVTMDFPQYQLTKIENNSIISELVKETVMDHKVEDICYSPDSKKLMIVLDESTDRLKLEKLSVDVSKLMEIHPTGDVVRGVSVTLRGTKNNGCKDVNGVPYDFVSRYFSPWNGIPEDPVTGSLHCALGPYWSKVLGKSKLYCRQCSRRGGEIIINIRSDGRIELSGNSVVVLSGNFSL